MKENIYRNEKVRGEEGQTQAQRKELADRERSFFNPNRSWHSLLSGAPIKSQIILAFWLDLMWTLELIYPFQDKVAEHTRYIFDYPPWHIFFKHNFKILRAFFRLTFPA